MKEVGIGGIEPPPPPPPPPPGPPGPPPPPPPPPPPSENTKIKHIFVLVMENRSFDHLLGFSGITGTDTQTGQTTTVEGLRLGDFYNDYTFQTNAPLISLPNTGPITSTDPIDPITSKLKSINPPPPPPPPPVWATLRYPVTPYAGDEIYDHQDVKHQFFDVMRQLCGQWQPIVPPNGGPYPQVAEVTKTGFAADYALNSDRYNPGEPMRCFSPENLRVLNALAGEFVVCDHWFSSMPGPTEPNRMFVHAATSGVWDDSPTNSDYEEIFGIKSNIINDSDYGIAFETGTIFDALRRANIPFRIYTGDLYPQVGLLAGINLNNDIDLFDNFAGDVNDPNYDAAYTFIEPRYDTLSQQLGLSFVNNSQHPANSVALGEQLIKSVYEAIRNSPHWNESMLIITWDEHGGFYDHVPPPRAKPIPSVSFPNGQPGKDHGFMFDQYGPRVPAVVISPWCPKNGIEHRQLEHSVIPATVLQNSGLPSLAPTTRDAGMIGLQTLATLDTARTDCPETLPAPVVAPQPAGPATGSRVVSSGNTSKVPPGGPIFGAPFPINEPSETAPGTPVGSSSGTPVNSPGGKVFGNLPPGATKVLTASVTETQVKSAEMATHVTASAPVTPVEPGPAASAPATQVGSSSPLDLSDPWLASTLAVAMKAHMQAVPADAANIKARVFGLKTVGDLAQYYNDITPIINNARNLARQQKVAARKQPVHR